MLVFKPGKGVGAKCSGSAQCDACLRLAAMDVMCCIRAPGGPTAWRPSGKVQTPIRAASHDACTGQRAEGRGQRRAEAITQMSRRRAVCDCRVKADCAGCARQQQRRRWWCAESHAAGLHRMDGRGPDCGDPCGLAKAELNLGEQFSRRRSSPFTPLHREDRFHISAAGSVHLHASRLLISQTRLLKFSPGAPVTTLFTAISESARTASRVALLPGADPFSPNATHARLCICIPSRAARRLLIADPPRVESEIRPAPRATAPAPAPAPAPAQQATATSPALARTHAARRPPLHPSPTSASPVLMSASAANAQNPPVAASSTATPANNSSSGSSANVAAGSAQPTARSSYANATKKISSPTIASSGAPAAVGAPQSAHHGKSSSASPVNGSGITPAVPAMPTIVSGGPNGDHSRKSSVHIKQTPPTSGAPSNIKFGSLAGSPAPAPAMPVAQGSNLNPQAQNPRVASPAHSPSPIPTPVSGGPKPDGLPTRPNLVFGGQGSESADGVSVTRALPRKI